MLSGTKPYDALLLQQANVHQMIADLQRTLTRPDLDPAERSQTEAMLGNALNLLRSYISSVSALHTEVQNSIIASTSVRSSPEPVQGGKRSVSPRPISVTGHSVDTPSYSSSFHSIPKSTVYKDELSGPSDPTPQPRAPSPVHVNGSSFWAEDGTQEEHGERVFNNDTSNHIISLTPKQSYGMPPRSSSAGSGRFGQRSRLSSKLYSTLSTNSYLQSPLYAPTEEESVSYAHSVNEYTVGNVSPHYLARNPVPQSVQNTIQSEALSMETMQLLYSVEKTYKYSRSVPKHYNVMHHRLITKAIAKATNNDTPKWKHIRRLAHEVWQHPELVQVTIHELTLNIYNNVSAKDFSKLEIRALIKAYNSLAIMLRFLELVPPGTHARIKENMLSDLLHIITRATDHLRACPGTKRAIAAAISLDFQGMLHLSMAFLMTLQQPCITGSLTFVRAIDGTMMNAAFFRRFTSLGDCLVIALNRLLKSRPYTQGLFAQTCVLAIFRFADSYLSCLTRVHEYLTSHDDEEYESFLVGLEDIYDRIHEHWEAAYDCRLDSTDGQLLSNVKPSIPKEIGGIEVAIPIPFEDGGEEEEYEEYSD
ncbi:hypothetical protein GMRT_12264 [Giardia muris]|uniref:Uncharacterized protein n=1 Tax=Giardia muris TaxID=5742 RepID=A0A4Z1SYN4_GIAMU|nr:hypothetical protein GMRT_12264 [Giardia muris]|eukprot:TNJ30580.1 hypothetical protein GMRT_12264 [Giardia muris]